jgi:uncharacterized membrane protein
MNHSNWWYGAVLACMGDVSTTWYGIEVLGGVEQNPLLAELMAATGVLPALVASKVGVLVVAMVLYRAVSEHEWGIPAILIAVYGVTTALNLIQIGLLG